MNPKYRFSIIMYITKCGSQNKKLGKEDSSGNFRYEKNKAAFCAYGQMTLSPSKWTLTISI